MTTQVEEALQLLKVCVEDYNIMSIKFRNYVPTIKRYVGLPAICSAVPELVRVPIEWKQVYSRRTSDPRSSQGTPYNSCALFGLLRASC